MFNDSNGNLVEWLAVDGRAISIGDCLVTDAIISPLQRECIDGLECRGVIPDGGKHIIVYQVLDDRRVRFLQIDNHRLETYPTLDLSGVMEHMATAAAQGRRLPAILDEEFLAKFQSDGGVRAWRA